MTIQITNPLDKPDWDELLLSYPGYSFFHSSAWARTLSESYGYTPLYFTILENGRLRALVPIMEVNSVLTGKRGVSLPFTDYCRPIADPDIQFQDLLDHIIDYGKKCGWKYIELRGGENLLPAASASETFLGHTLDLSKGEEKIFSSLRDSTRRNIKKAAAQGVIVEKSNSQEAIKEFYRLNCMTRKEHGLPPQPYHFFQKVYDHIFSKGLGFVTLASRNGTSIAGAVFFHFGDQGIYKYGASDKKYQDFRANNLVMWEGIKWFSDNGYKSFCFGRTESENTGLRQFKTGWGPEEYSIPYYRYDLANGRFIPSHKKSPPIYNRIFREMPIPLLNLIGSSLYKHMG